MLEKQIDLFYLGDGTPAHGVVYFSRDDAQFTCGINFAMPGGGGVQARLELSTQGSVLDWCTFKFEEGGDVILVERTADGTLVDGQPASFQQGVLPGYACSALVLELIERGKSVTEFTWLTESGLRAADGSEFKPASLTSAGSEAVASPHLGELAECTKVELRVDDQRTNTYWVKDGAIVKSDWAGAQSFALPKSVSERISAT